MGAGVTDHLLSVKRAARAKALADTRYKAELIAARRAGVSFADLARASGISRQAVRQLLGRHSAAVD